ncbi:MAG: hypothetical protein IJ132_03825 [Firmicutes bacterium]|nr:hypothetical protein [Bacillota bacterium]
MRYPDAFIGVKRIYTAQILMIIGSIALVIGAIIAIAGTGVNSTGTLAGGGILALAAIIAVLVGFIMEIIGINTARRDEEAFKNALIWVVVGIVLSVLSGSLQNNNSNLSNLFEAAGTATQLLTTYYIIMGVRNLAVKMDNMEVVAKSDTTMKVVLAVYIVQIILGIVGIVIGIAAPEKDGALMAAAGSIGILGAITGILGIIAFILLLSLLSKAKDMLME